MSLSILNTSTIPALEQVLNFADRRHSILASNIANLDVPGYRSRDISPELFESRLKEALDARPTSVSPGVSGSFAPEVDFSQARDSTREILFHDGSDVGLEHQVTEISKNQGRFNMAIAIMTSQFRLLQAAISERA
ncbi:MAG: flagellar basal body rod protein FlgB [Planctomycetota bacterium]|nr:MAG: flagellar basal body rod protein FlgB [Planctomycetota bacterium]REJ94392.1 MAG: flagellar basal body rod protein FlgB [Planctomycetota bacterium]REK22075.1 MAG: flagellar basal body rod protein FlgB [Planctomycetota bacterium]REK44483.1 MAG: flagellar basal body rod protein FlgB [Planctomycetota bacterium]